MEIVFHELVATVLLMQYLYSDLNNASQKYASFMPGVVIHLNILLF